MGARGKGGPSVFYLMSCLSRPVSLSSGRRHVRSNHSSSLEICFSNIRGLRTNYDEVSHFLQVRSPDLLALSESKLDSSVSSSEFTPDGYTFHRMDKAPCHGLVLFAKTSLPLRRLRESEDSRHEYLAFLAPLPITTLILIFFVQIFN